MGSPCASRRLSSSPKVLQNHFLQSLLGGWHRRLYTETCSHTHTNSWRPAGKYDVLAWRHWSADRRNVTGKTHSISEISNSDTQIYVCSSLSTSNMSYLSASLDILIIFFYFSMPIFCQCCKSSWWNHWPTARIQFAWVLLQGHCFALITTAFSEKSSSSYFLGNCHSKIWFRIKSQTTFDIVSEISLRFLQPYNSGTEMFLSQVITAFPARLKTCFKNALKCHKCTN